MLVGIALLMTVGVYGLVAGIVKLDDVGLYLARSPGPRCRAALGRGIVRAAPWLMKCLSIAGTLAMFLVGGGILTHGIGVLHHAIEALGRTLGGVPSGGSDLGPLTPTLGSTSSRPASSVAPSWSVVVALVRKLWPRTTQGGAPGGEPQRRK